MSVQVSVQGAKTARLEVRLSVQELEQLQQRAGQQGVSVSEFARRALDLYVGASKPETETVPVVVPEPSRAAPSAKPFGCPVCSWRTDNIKAHCPTHGRSVVGR